MSNLSASQWKQPRAMLPAIMLLSVSMLNFEIGLTKIFSVTLWYHFGYFVVSLSLFGIGAGGIISYVASEKYPNFDPAKWIVRCVFLTGIAIIASLLLDVNVDFSLGLTSLKSVGFTRGAIVRSVFILAGIYLISSIPFYLFGLVLSLIFRHFSANTSKIYAFDLAGSAAGCLIFLGLITIFSGPTVIVFSSAIAFLSYLLFILAQKGRLPVPSLGASAVLASAFFLINGTTGVFHIKHEKIYRNPKSKLFEKWSPLARIAVYSDSIWKVNPKNPFGWGMSKVWKPTHPLDQLWIDQDSAAGTPVTKFDGDFSKIEHLKYDVTAIAYRWKKFDDVFVIGSGGGRDVLTAKMFGSSSVEACDINPVIIEVVRERFKDFAGGIYDYPGVLVKIGDARNVIRYSPEKYDLIQMSLIDSFAATMAGALSLSENSLYTIEAFRDYWDHLKDDGVLSFTRYLTVPRTQTLRVLSVTRAMLEENGIADPRDHIAVISTTDGMGLATIIIKKSPLTASDIETLKEQARQLQFNVLLMPGEAGDEDFEDLFSSKTIDDFAGRYLEQYRYDMTPTTDDRPFFFQMVHFSGIWDLATGTRFVGQKSSYYAVLVVAIIFFIALLVTGIFMFFPLLLSRKTGGIPFRWGTYCLLIGMGFMFVEIPLMQKGSLYLGHPTYSFSVVLFSLLLFCSLGSYLSKRFNTGKQRTAGKLALAIAFALLLQVAATERVFPATLGWPFLARVILIMALVAMAAVLMGGAFPLGIVGLSRIKPEAIPWAWAINGAASVLGSVMAMALSMAIGYRLAFLAGVVCYLAAGMVLFASSRNQMAVQASGDDPNPG